MLVISADVFNDRSGTVIALALTSQEPRAGFPLTLALGDPDPPRRSWVKISQFGTLSTERLGDCLGWATPEELGDILEGLVEIVGG